MALRRIIMLLLVFGLIVSVVVPALAAEDSDYFVLLPYGNYPFEYNMTDNYSYFAAYDIREIDPSLPITVRFYDSYYTGRWEWSDVSGCWVFGDIWYGDPFSLGYADGMILVLFLGPCSSDPGVLLEIYQGARNPNVPDPGPDSDTIVDVSITHMLGYVMGWWSIFWSHLLYGQLSPLLPLLAVFVAVSLFLVVIKLIHKYF